MFRWNASCLRNLHANAKYRAILESSPPHQCFRRSTRFLHLEIPDIEPECKLRLNNFDRVYPTLKLPYKMTHPEHVETAKQFIRYRLERYPDGLPPLRLEDYESLYAHLPEHDARRAKIVDDLNMLLLYYNRVLSKSVFCPSTIPLFDMKRIIDEYDTYGARIRYVHFLFVREFDQWRLAIEEEARRDARRAKEAEEIANFEQIGCFDSRGALQYGFWRNTLFSRYFEKTKHRYSLNRLRQAQMFGQSIVIDCSFDEGMADYETISVARQISAIYHSNRYSRDPFRLLFTGVCRANRGYQHAFRLLRNVIENESYFFNLHNESYRELFAKSETDRLIYLSPDARKLMTKFDPEAIYIIGALVSKTQKSCYTFQKARAEGIECLRLPIHQYVELKPGVKRVLSFQGVFKILLELKEHGDWERALKAGIAAHKLRNDNEVDRRHSQQDKMIIEK